MLVQSGRPLFLFPMQMEVDYSIRAYSPFNGMRETLRMVLTSFFRHAPRDAVLVVKLHPLDPGLRRWKDWLTREAERHSAGRDRILFVDGGSLDQLLASARGHGDSQQHGRCDGVAGRRTHHDVGRRHIRYAQPNLARRGWMTSGRTPRHPRPRP